MIKFVTKTEYIQWFYVKYIKIYIVLRFSFIIVIIISIKILKENCFIHSFNYFQHCIHIIKKKKTCIYKMKFIYLLKGIMNIYIKLGYKEKYIACMFSSIIFSSRFILFQVSSLFLFFLFDLCYTCYRKLLQ